MEYRRRKRRRRRMAHGSSGASGGAVKTVVLLLIAALIIYLICGTEIGAFITDKVFVPLFRTQAEPTPEATATQTPATTPRPQAMGSTEVQLPSISLHLLQMGVFSSSENAAELMAQLKAIGASGYAYEDRGNIRVIAAAYVDESSAKSVCDRLNSTGLECTLYTVSAQGVELLITAAEERLFPIETAFTLAYDCVSDLSEAVIDFDAAMRTIDYELIILEEMRQNALNAAGAISTPAASNELLKIVYEYYEQVARILDGITAKTERNAFSSALKTAMIEIALLYVDMLENIGG